MSSPRANASAAEHAYRIVVARTVEEVEALRHAWTSLPADSVTADMDYYLEELQADETVVRPHVLGLERNGKVEVLFIAYLRNVHLPCRLGYRVVYSPRLRSISLVERGVLGDVDEEAATIIVDEVRNALDRGEADVARIHHLDVDSALYRVAATRPPSTLRHAPPVASAWQIALSGSADEYLASLSRKTRETVRRDGRRLTRDFDVSQRVFRCADEIDAFSREVETIAAKTWQRRVGGGFEDDDRWRRRTHFGTERNLFYGYVLYLDGQAAAFWYGLAYGGRFFPETTGYDPAFRSYRVGTYLLLRVIEDLTGRRAASVLDLGTGDDDYKRQLARQTGSTGDVLVYARRLRPVRVNLTRRALFRTWNTTKAVAQRLDLTRLIKRRLRSRHAKK